MDVLLIEDDEAFAFALQEFLGQRGYHLTIVKEGKRGLEEFSKGYGCILLDLGLPDIDGIRLIPLMRQKGEHPPIICLTGRDDAHTAVEAMKSGAYDYITKPVDLEELLIVLQRVAEMSSLHAKVAYLEGREEPILIGKSRALEEVRRLIERVSPYPTPVLIVGETGVGKEVVARLIHKASGRPGNFVDINCGAIPRDLFEGELFGFKAGTFTGAMRNKKGLIQWGDKGTIFFDEISDLPLDLQPKLLRVLEQGEVRPLGEGKNIKVDVRVIAATNTPPDGMLACGRMRQDLYFRLSTFLISIPPLRERSDDIRPLADYFLALFSQRMRKGINGFSDEVIDLFFRYPWPGNVRELKNVIERGVIMCDGKTIELQHLPLMPACPPQEITPLAELERRHIEAALQRFQGNISRAAKALQIPRSTLRDKIRDLGINYDH